MKIYFFVSQRIEETKTSTSIFRVHQSVALSFRERFKTVQYVATFLKMMPSFCAMIQRNTKP